ncbi:TPA: hypothetical protein DIS56_02670 [Candidatus Saccharibacteria bacterium]|nr:MAG: hypothetical protein UX30_C0006G0008 [Candidatus Saccharibacteria bacterium GW2011_GWA2_46_10]OGL36197.1 MAG: hypothetical protein A3F05_02755 [Candidatus Saccharibacteria bacterium RIFCSPHIGHO2_12_FULL_47_17]HCM52014.1 hypothetical protein [Candidatus Saccharibacteria bacterium]
MTNKKDYSEVLLEDMNSKFKLILEAVGGMQDQVKKIPKMAEQIEKIEYEINAIRLDTSFTRDGVSLVKIRTEKLEALQEDVTDLQKRVKALESA